MCTVCGCGQAKVEGDKSQDHSHDHGHHHHDHDHGHHHHDHEHSHDHNHDHVHDDGENVHYGKGIGGAHVPGMSQSRIIEIEQNILGKNDSLADKNRALFAAKSQFVLNLVSSPGSGKTTLLTRTVTDLKSDFPVAVIEGDQQTANDADRIRETGVPAIQVNTGKGCHLDAHMVGHAAEKLDLENGGLLFIENVGNLVCPAAFDLGEAHKVAILSVTEGEDKPIKYPDMFDAADLMILTKVDLLPYLTFDVDQCIEYARRVNPDIQVLLVSSTSGEGLDGWYDWIKQGASKAGETAAVAAGE